MRFHTSRSSVSGKRIGTRPWRRPATTNAAWFALASVVLKEWVYRATKRVADEEQSPVLLANAVHHRSDGFGSAVALVAILGNWWFPHLALDPIGGASHAT